MVDDRVTDGPRIAQFLASEVHGRADGGLDRLSVGDADPDVEPSTDGTLAYRLTSDGERFGAVYVHPDRARIEVAEAPDAVVEAVEGVGRRREQEAGDTDLRVRPKAVQPPRAIVFVESAAATKRAADALGAAAAAVDGA